MTRVPSRYISLLSRVLLECSAKHTDGFYGLDRMNRSIEPSSCKTRMKWAASVLLSVIVVIVGQASAQIPCDDAYGANCPEAGGWQVGECLKKVKDLSADCKSFIALHDACKDDFLAHCNGKEYTGDAISCLSEWTKPENLSADCLAALPKKETKERVLSPEEKKKAANRRK